MQAVGQLDEHDADVLGHRQEHLAHVLGPQILAVQLGTVRRRASTLQELHLVELGDAVDQAGDLAAKAAVDVGHRHAAVFGDVVAQSAATSVAPSMWRLARVSATASGWLMYGSPDSRFWPSCASAAKV